MSAYRRWLPVVLGIGLMLLVLPWFATHRSEQPRAPTLRKLADSRQGDIDPPPLPGLDLSKLERQSKLWTTSLADGRSILLTLDPELQTNAVRLLRRYGVPEAGIVVMEAKTGKIVVYASRAPEDEKVDVNLRAEAPAASIFKLVTSAALVEQAGLHPETVQCYHGGRSRIVASELDDDPTLDQSCVNLATALGKSTNVVFARLAVKHLTTQGLGGMAGALGFGTSVPFIAPNEAPSIELPEERLEFARSAAGFWHTTLSPLAAASLAQTIANGGIVLEPRIVSAIRKGQATQWEEQRDPRPLRRALRSDTAEQLTRMMIKTTNGGSASKVFHDERGRSYFPGTVIAAKTGTLNRASSNRLYTWFVGFAPATKPELAFAVLVVNTPTWRIKAPELAREVLSGYFENASAKVPLRN